MRATCPIKLTLLHLITLITNSTNHISPFYTNLFNLLLKERR